MSGKSHGETNRSATGTGRRTGLAIGAGIVVLAVVGVLAARYWLDPERRLARLREHDPVGAAKAAADVALRENPDYERVAVDEEARTVTLRNRQTGARVTLSFDDLLGTAAPPPTAAPPMVFESEDQSSARRRPEPPPPAEPPETGAATLADVPEWVPRHPRAADLVVRFANRGERSASGALTFTTGDGARAVLDHFAAPLRTAGYRLEQTPSPQGSGGMLVATLEDGRRAVRVSARTAGGTTTVVVQYQSREPAAGS